MNPENDPLPPSGLRLPVFKTKPISHWPRKMSWEAVMRETEAFRQFYLKHYDSPERRLRNKNPKPFRM